MRSKPHVSWLPFVLIAMAQILLILNSTIFKVCIDTLAESFHTPITTVKTAMVIYSLVAAGFIMLGTKIAHRYGPKRVFRTMVALFGGTMMVMTVCPNSVTLMVAQVVAGAVTAILLPTLVMLISAYYRGGQYTQALSWFGAVQVMGVVPAFLVAGAVATWIGWRVTFALLVLLSIGIYVLSGRLAPVTHSAHVRIDSVGVVLVALAMLLIGIGCNNLTSWGFLWAQPKAPFNIFHVSPAPIIVLCGVLLIQAFFFWTRQCHVTGRPSLISLEVIEASRDRRWVLFSLFAIGVLGSAITFVVPLYIEAVQGRSSLYTAIAIFPFSLASFAAAVLVSKLQGRLRPSRIARSAFLAVTVGALLFGFTMHNDWSDYMVILGMIIVGMGEGTLVTLLFNMLVTTAPRNLAGDVEPLCGTTEYFSAGVGIALSGALVVSVLTAVAHRELAENASLPPVLKEQIDLDNVAFVRNDYLRETLARTTATPDQVAEAVHINAEARLLALRVSFFTLAGLALLAFFPARLLPDYAVSDLDDSVHEMEAGAETVALES